MPDHLASVRFPFLRMPRPNDPTSWVPAALAQSLHPVGTPPSHRHLLALRRPRHASADAGTRSWVCSPSFVRIWGVTADGQVHDFWLAEQTVTTVARNAAPDEGRRGEEG